MPTGVDGHRTNGVASVWLQDVFGRPVKDYYETDKKIEPREATIKN